MSFDALATLTKVAWSVEHEKNFQVQSGLAQERSHQLQVLREASQLLPRGQAVGLLRTVQEPKPSLRQAMPVGSVLRPPKLAARAKFLVPTRQGSPKVYR